MKHVSDSTIVENQAYLLHTTNLYRATVCLWFRFEIIVFVFEFQWLQMRWDSEYNLLVNIIVQ